jgi:hypothetical protein
MLKAEVPHALRDSPDVRILDVLIMNIRDAENDPSSRRSPADAASPMSAFHEQPAHRVMFEAKRRNARLYIACGDVAER